MDNLKTESIVNYTFLAVSVYYMSLLINYKSRIFVMFKKDYEFIKQQFRK